VELSRGRKWLYWAITLAVPLLLLALFEGIARLASPWVSDDPYLTMYGEADFISEEEQDGVRVARIEHDQVYRARNAVFPVDKDENTVRIFAVGGSASAGWPHPPSEIYTVYLERALQDAFPSKNIEVINASGRAYPSYRVRLIFEEMLEYDPDLIIVYSGNNEFIEDRAYAAIQARFKPLVMLAHKSAAFRLAKQWLKGDPRGEDSFWANWRASMRFSIWSKVEQRALKLRDDPTQFEGVKQHYGHSIEAMARKAQRRGTPVILATVPVNLRDWRPNVSVESLSGPDHSRWKTLYIEGRRALLERDAVGAASALQGAVALDPQHAASHYYLARALEQTGKHVEANLEYREARDQDRNPFRSISPFDETLQGVASRYANVHVADLGAAFQLASEFSAPGYDLFLDYVHPTRRGNLIVAATVFDTIVGKGILGTVEGQARFNSSPTESAGEESSYDEARDYPMQGTLLRLFGQMHQYEDMVEKASLLAGMTAVSERAEERHLWKPEETEILVAAVLDVFPDYLALQEEQILGTPVAPAESERIVDRVREFYLEHYGDYRYETSEWPADSALFRVE
jgi:tetratricopeptide (TPR) repeat protein